MNNVEYVSIAAEISRQAGAQILPYLEQPLEMEYKGAFDLVTAADRASEKLIVERLQSRFPGHSIVAEEGSGVETGSEYVWYVDPLDGTTNFAHGFPAFCVSIGLAFRGEMVAGVVYDPLREELFSAERGSGAYLNSRRIQVSKRESLQESLLGTGFASPKRHADINVYFFHQVCMLTHGVRRTGSAALDLCSVASGRLEGFWEFGLNAWDVAAGLLMIQEAGGTYQDMKGERYELAGPHLTASNGRIQQELLKLFEDVFAGRYRTPIPPLTI